MTATEMTAALANMDAAALKETIKMLSRFLVSNTVFEPSTGLDRTEADTVRLKAQLRLNQLEGRTKRNPLEVQRQIEAERPAREKAADDKRKADEPFRRARKLPENYGRSDESLRAELAAAEKAAVKAEKARTFKIKSDYMAAQNEDGSEGDE